MRPERRTWDSKNFENETSRDETRTGNAVQVFLLCTTPWLGDVTLDPSCILAVLFKSGGVKYGNAAAARAHVFSVATGCA